MRLPQNLLPICLLLALSAAAPAVTAQSPDSLSAQPVPSRVVERVDETQRVTLAGNTHPMARKQFETGSVEPSRQMERMMLVLKRSPEQEAALTAFNAQQYDPHSPNYHHWLHADEFGSLYGPSDSDLAAVTSWLQNHGFAIYDVSKGRTMIQFSGTAAQVQEAFNVEMHTYNVNGEAHIANDRDPSIPAALAPVVTGIASLHDFFPKPQHVLGKRVNFDTRTHKETLAEGQSAAPAKSNSSPLAQLGKSASAKGASPQFTYSANGDTYEDLTPYDFATIYNILPLWKESTPINGKGVTIAISGVSDVSTSDFNTFRSAFGLPATTLKTIVNGADPGEDGGGGQGENSLDVEMAGATAPGASIVLVVSASTATTGGDQLSDEYIVDNVDTVGAHIMTASYGECELGLGSAGNSAFNTIWQQGATEGISIFESSGDQGSAGCSSQDTAAPNADQIGLQVNGMASSPYVTAVGGTDFTWSFTSNGTATYWNTSNGTQLQTAKGYMPEIPWNSTCANPELVPLFGATSTEELCNGLIDYDNGYFDGLIVIAAGSGGVSHCTTPTGTTSSSCAGGWAKPSWQTGYGSSTKREVPDVSLFASGGFPSTVNGSAILFCFSVSSACAYNPEEPSLIEAQQVGGTSASSPLWAGIMALIEQKTGSAQGLANPTLYSLYAKQVKAGTSCNSSTVANGNSCTFYDTTAGTNAQVCFTGAPNCVTNTSGDQLGILSGYTTAAGYDDTTGIGTPNVTNLVNAWPTTTIAPAVTLTPTSLTFASTTVGSTTAAQTVTIKNSGTAALTLTSETITGTNASSFLKSATTCSTSLAVGATCTVSVEFKPAASGALTAALSIADNASGSPQSVSLKGTGTSTATSAITITPSSITFPSTVVGSTSAAQVITIKNTGSAAVSITSMSFTGTNASSFTKGPNSCPASLAVGNSCTLSLYFKPASAGALTGTYNLGDSAANSPQTVSLKGTGN